MKKILSFAVLIALTALWCSCEKVPEEEKKDSDSYRVAIPEAVDLGLSVKWASFNLGASKPEEYGDFFAWGEIAPHYISGSVQQENPVWKSGKESGYDWQSYQWCVGSNTKLTKYCSFSNFGNNGFKDGKTELDKEDDAVIQSLGGKWRMPTYDDYYELSNNCTWEQTSINGVNGRKVTGPNGNSIFLPATGYWHQGIVWDLKGQVGYYWSSSVVHLDFYEPDCSWCFGFDNTDKISPGRRLCERSSGLPIRPVCN